MNRSLYVLTALLLACAALAAPAPPPLLPGWGKPINPDKDCKFRRGKESLTIEMPGGDHDYDTVRKRLNAPRFVREFEGDFEIQVRIRIDSIPSAKSNAKDASENDLAGVGVGFSGDKRMIIRPNSFEHPKELPSFVAAGFLVIPPRPFSELFRRFEYGVAGAGTGVDGFITQLSRDDGGGGVYGAVNKNWREWPFKVKPEHVYMRLERQDISLLCKIGPDGKSWVSIGGGNLLGLPPKLKVGLAAFSTSTDPSKVIFDQLQIIRDKKREPWEFVSGWGEPVDPDKDCKIQRDKDNLTIEMPGIDHDYDPVRKRFNAPRLISDLEGEFDVQVRVRIDSRPSAQSTVKGQPSYVSAGFLLIYPDKEFSICARLEYAVSQPRDRLGAPLAEPRLAEPRRKESAPEGKEENSCATMKRWAGVPQRKGNTIEYDHGRPKQNINVMWEREWQNWPLPEKAEYAYLRLDHRVGGWSSFYISPDGEKWTRLDFLPSVPAGGKVGLAAFSTSTEPSKVIFDQLKIARGK